MKVLSRLILLLLTFCLLACPSRERRDQAVTDLEKICSALPVPQTFQRTRAYKKIEWTIVSIASQYQTTESCDAVGSHFRKHFLSQGWDPSRMKTKRFDTGLPTIVFEFRDADYTVNVECQTDVRDDESKLAGIYCRWGYP